MGLLSLLWFLVRVVPKPSRAAYPCQRVVFPVASSFVVWVMAVLGSAFAWRKARQRELGFWKVCLWGAAAVAGCALVVASLPTMRALAGNPPHGIYGVAKGIFPGRVAWVYGPEATSWAGYSSPEHWFETNHTDLAVVEAMMSQAVQAVGGGNSDAAAWDAIFRYFNQRHGRGQRGYQAGEKIAIKINLTTCNARSGTQTVDLTGTYEKQNQYSDGHWLNTIDNSPQMLLSLLRHLVYTVGVDQTNIFVGDPTGNFPRYMWNKLHPEFPAVHYFDNYGGAGRMRVALSAVPFYWSATNANTPGQPVVQDYVPVPFAQADYIINFAVLKGHSVGVTLCGKNFYGALLRCPDGYYRDASGPNQGGTLNYSSMHKSTPDPSMGPPGLGHYRAIVDLLGSPVLGDKTCGWWMDCLAAIIGTRIPPLGTCRPSTAAGLRVFLPRRTRWPLTRCATTFC
jgi:ketosteroid isomerase-like protein